MHHLRLFTCTVFALALVMGGKLRAATLIWTNTAGGDWFAATNWSPNQVPGGSDSAYITNSGNYAVGYGGYAAISNLVIGGVSGTQTFTMTYTLTNNGKIKVNANGVLMDHLDSFQSYWGTLTGPGSLTVTGTLNWDGTLAIPLINNHGSAHLAANSPGLVGCTFVNSGSLVVETYLALASGAVLTNAPSGVIYSTNLVNSDPSWTPSFQAAGGNARVDNAGLLVGPMRVKASSPFHLTMSRRGWDIRRCPFSTTARC